MSSISLPKPRRMAAAERQRKAPGRQLGVVGAAATSSQDQSAAPLSAISPAQFWKVVMVLAMALSVYNAIGTALLGSDWLFAWPTWRPNGPTSHRNRRPASALSLQSGLLDCKNNAVELDKPTSNSGSMTNAEGGLSSPPLPSSASSRAAVAWVEIEVSTLDLRC